MNFECERIPVISISNGPLFPRSDSSLMVGPGAIQETIANLQTSKNKWVVIVSLRHPISSDETKPSDFYDVGTLSQVKKCVRLDDDMRVHVSGLTRVKVTDFVESDGVLSAICRPLALAHSETMTTKAELLEIESLLKSWCLAFRDQSKAIDMSYLKKPILVGTLVSNVMGTISSFKSSLSCADSESPSRLKEVVHLDEGIMDKFVVGRQRLLEQTDIAQLTSMIKNLLANELQNLQMPTPA